MRSSSIGVLVMVAACRGALGAPNPNVTNPDDAAVPGAPSGGDDAGSHQGPGDRADASTAPPGMMPPPAVPSTDAMPAPTVDTPAGFPSAPAFPSQIEYSARHGNVTLFLPAVSGAQDYRVFALEDGVEVSAVAEGREHVDGATIFCAGLVQHNQCDDGEALTSYGPTFRVPRCSADARAVSLAKSVLNRLQITGLQGKVKLVVEAVGERCPFGGAYGQKSAQLDVVNDGVLTAQAIHQGKTVTWPLCPRTVPIRSESELRSAYGSLFINGQAPAATTPGSSPWENIGLPAPASDPAVLARAVIEVDALDPTTLPAGFTGEDFFESFSDPTDQPKPVPNAQVITPNAQIYEPRLSQTKNLSLYNFGADIPQLFVAQGVLRSVLPDAAQGIMASAIMYPKRAFELPEDDSKYLHATFEVPTDSTQRRYWWFHVCGAPEVGKTIVNGAIAPQAAIVPFPSFMNPLEGTSISTRGWNCIQIVPRGGTYDVFPGGPYEDTKLGAARAETDLRILVNEPVPGANGIRGLTDTIINVSPMMAGGVEGIDGAWIRQWDDEHELKSVLLDDKLFVDQRVTFDVYLNRGRMVVYADGVQKVCNDFPKQRLTMAEGAVGLGHVLYHSSAERLEFMREDWLRTGQYHYLHNVPFLDERSFDNFGVREGASLPADFRPAQCFTSTE